LYAWWLTRRAIGKIRTAKALTAKPECAFLHMSAPLSRRSLDRWSGKEASWRAETLPKIHLVEIWRQCAVTT
jgi:hypothetical protein